MEKDKTIRVSDEIMQMLIDRKDKNISISAAITTMLDRYTPTDFIRREDDKFVLVLDSYTVEVPTFTPVNKIVRLSPVVYERLQNIKAHPDESFNLILFRLITATRTPFILNLGKLHTRMAEEYKKYCFDAGFNLSDMIEVISTDTDESKLVARGSNETVKVWTEAFSEKYEFRQCDKLFCPDAMAYQIYLFIGEYENKIGCSLTMSIMLANLRKYRNKQ